MRLASNPNVSSVESQGILREVLDDIDDEGWLDTLPEDHPGRSLAELLADPEKSINMAPDDKRRVREHLSDMMLADLSYLDPEVDAEVGRQATVAMKNPVAKKARARAMKKIKKFPDWKKPKELAGAVATFLKGLVGALRGPDSVKPSGAPHGPIQQKIHDGIGKKKEPQHKPGDVWSNGSEFGAKNQEGEIIYFKSRESAEAFAKGERDRVLTGSLEWDFTPWVELSHSGV